MKCPHCEKELDVESITREMSTDCEFVDDLWCEIRKSRCRECGKTVEVRSYYELVHYTDEVEPVESEREEGSRMKEDWEIMQDLNHDHAVLMRERDEEMDAILREYAPDEEP